MSNNTPEWVKEIDGDIIRSIWDCSDRMVNNRQSAQKLKFLVSALKIAIEALEFYANRQHVGIQGQEGFDHGFQDVRFQWAIEHGLRAREALEKIRKGEFK